MKLFVAHKMTRNTGNTLNKVHVAATELLQLMLESTRYKQAAQILTATLCSSVNTHVDVCLQNCTELLLEFVQL